MHYSLICTVCGNAAKEDSHAFRCGSCGAILEVTYNYKEIKLDNNFKQLPISHAKYAAFFPIQKKLFTLNEGGTPLTETALFGNNIKFKLETKNPTKSFKDRGSSIEITKAIELNFDRVCCASTGNMGLSIATYAKHAGINCTIFISKDANPEKITKIKNAGSAIVEIDGDFNDSLEAAEKFSKENGCFLCGDYHYRKEGQKSMMFEIIEQLKYDIPDMLFLPIGNATLLAAVYKALVDFKNLSFIKKLPKIVAVQAAGCSPLINAYNNGENIKRVKPKTIADAIAVGYPTFGFEGIKAINETSGLAISVTDQDILTAMDTLKKEGIESEPGGAAAFAGFLKLNKARNKNVYGKRCSIIISGNNEGP